MSSDWGPPGLDTTAPPVNRRLVALVVFGLVVMIGVPWCTKNVGYVDHFSWHRTCGDPPSEIRSWTSPYDSRTAEQVIDLRKWATRHPGRVNNQYDPFCNTPLHLAARVGREDLADVLLAAGADVDARNKLDERPLHVAAKYGRPTVAKLLIGRGADVSARLRGGQTPLHQAACGLGSQSNIDGRIEVARLLLAAGADVNARQPGSGFTPLRCAVSYESRNTAMAELLHAHGADRRGAEERPRPR